MFSIAFPEHTDGEKVAALEDAALRGLGLAYVAESSVRDPLQRKELVRVLDAFCLPFPGLFLYYPSRVGTSRNGLFSAAKVAGYPLGRPGADGSRHYATRIQHGRVTLRFDTFCV